jgi:predicted metal-dependent RNase
MSILKELQKKLPSDAEISEVKFEGSEIILYTKSKSFFLSNEPFVRGIVSQLKKRVEIRPDLTITMDQEKAKEFILKSVPKEANIEAIYFEPEMGKVVIEARKPGLVIGKNGSTYKMLRDSTFWLPKIERAPAIDSKIVRAVRNLLHSEIDYRKKFLNRVGTEINAKPLTEEERKDEWIRVTSLGGFREVGRSCILVQTSISNVLLDCGVNVGASGKDAFPCLDAPEFDMDKLDAICLSHSHLDHSGFIPHLYESGYKGPLYCTAPTRDLMVLLCMDYIDVCQKEGRKVSYTKKAIEKAIKHSVILNYGEVNDITRDMRLTLQPAGHLLGSSMIHLHIGEGLHNILYSLDSKTPVTIVDSNNNVLFEPIGKVIDEMFEKYPELVVKRGSVEETINPEGIKTLSFNPETYKTETREITGFIRHPVSEDLYEIVTESGKRAVVTKSHSVFSVIDSEVRATEVSSLKKGDFIIGPKKLPESEIEAEINLLPYAHKLRLHINDNNLLKETMRRFENKMRKLKIQKEKVREYMNWIYDHYKNGFYKVQIAKKYHVHPRRIRKIFRQLGIRDQPRVKHSLPANFRISKDFARFLGYFVSEGFIRGNTVAISNYSKTILNDVNSAVKKSLGLEGDIRISDGCVLFHSKQLRILLKEILKCGNNAYEKRVPSQILLAPKDIVSAFLSGYFSGDGGVKITERGRGIFASTKNPDLIQDISFLLLHFGIVPKLLYNKTNDMHSLQIYSSEQIAIFLENITMYNSKIEALKSELKGVKMRKSGFDSRIPISSLSEATQEIISRSPWQNSISCGIPVLGEIELPPPDMSIVNSDFVFDRIKSIKKVKSSNKYVYDFKVAGYENFLGGSGFLFLHNTADFKFGPSKLFDPAFKDFQRIETMIMESTYGAADDVFPKHRDTEEHLLQIIERVMKRGGKVLIPIFGVGRSQEIMAILASMPQGRKFQYPVYMEGMVWDATAIHTAYPEYLSRYLQRKIFHYGENPFLSDIFHRVAPRERNEVIDSTEPAVIMATSGMLIGGPSVEYLKALAADKKNMLIFVGYQGEGTLGSRIQKGWKEIPMRSESGKTKTLELRMEVETVKGLSGHSGRNQLISYLYNITSKPEKVIVNHGDPKKCVEFSRDIHKLFRCESVAPKNMETIRLK